MVTYHAPEGDDDGDDVGGHEHGLGFESPPFLEIPESVAAEDTCGGLSEAKVGRLEERELNLLVLNDRDDCSGRVQSVGQQEERKEVDKGVPGW